MPALIAALGLLRRCWPYAIAGAALIGACIWLDHRGYARGVAHVEARDAKAAARIEAASAKLLRAFDVTARALDDARRHQDQAFTGIRNAAAPIILRPIYRTVAVDADGVGLLDRAAAAANGDPAGEPADDASTAAELPAQR